LTTTVEPKPPYRPGDAMHVVISGSGVANMQDFAYSQLRGAGMTFLAAGSQAEKSGNPPVFKFDVIVPKYSNTATPELAFSFNDKNGVMESMNSSNTPAFRNLTFEGLTIDQKKPEVSNFKFVEDGNGKGHVTFDVNEESGLRPTINGFMLDGKMHYLDGLLKCTGSAPNFHCEQSLEYPPTSSGALQLSMSVRDLAGNESQINQTAEIQKSESAESSSPAIDWPAQATVCPDGTLRIGYGSKGGGGIFESHVGIWSTNGNTSSSSSGLAAGAYSTCSQNSCEATMAIPTFASVQQGTVGASVDGNGSQSSVGGIAAGNKLRISLTGKNGKSTDYEIPTQNLSELFKAPKGVACNVIDIYKDGAKPAGSGEEQPSDPNRNTSKGTATH
jgi:hypothetical protein